MSLEEKVGQLFVMRVYGHSATDPDQVDIDENLKEIGVRTAAELIAKYHVGGIIYFTWARNTRDPHQIADLSNGLQHAALAERSRVPLIVSTDQEHGIVCRLGAPATLLPGAMALGAGASRSDTRRAAWIASARNWPRSASTRTTRRTPTSTSIRPTRSSACGPSAPTPTRWPTWSRRR